MNIGFVSSWLERGAAYVTKNYMDMLKNKNKLFVFARGGEFFDSDFEYKDARITAGYRLQGTSINWRQFRKWIVENSLDMVIFNEQNDLECVIKARKEFPQLLLGSYIDYYTEDSVESFSNYHFLLCNTKRHFSVFAWHPGAYYLPWGVNLDTFSVTHKSNNNEIVFFHSMGMSKRKGTAIAIKSFINSGVYNQGGKLLIHTQCGIDDIISNDNCKKYNIEVVIKTVPHPGLYFRGDVYLYPTTLDGLGLTMYEALASGLPVITTNEAPMNEVIDKSNGYLVDVESYHSRSDAYYWPLAYVSESSLEEAIIYYVNNRKMLPEYQSKARESAEVKWDIQYTKRKMESIIKDVIRRKKDLQNYVNGHCKTQTSNNRELFHEVMCVILPDRVASFIRDKIEERRRKA